MITKADALNCVRSSLLRTLETYNIAGTGLEDLYVLNTADLNRLTIRLIEELNNHGITMEKSLT